MMMMLAMDSFGYVTSFRFWGLLVMVGHCVFCFMILGYMLLVFFGCFKLAYSLGYWKLMVVGIFVHSYCVFFGFGL